MSTQEAVNLLREVVRRAKPGETISVVGCDRIQLAAIGSSYLREFGGTWRLDGKINELVLGTILVRFVVVDESFSGHHVVIVK